MPEKKNTAPKVSGRLMNKIADRWSKERGETGREREEREQRAKRMGKLFEDIKKLIRDSGCTPKEADQVLGALHGTSALIVNGGDCT